VSHKSWGCEILASFVPENVAAVLSSAWEPGPHHEKMNKEENPGTDPTILEGSLFCVNIETIRIRIQGAKAMLIHADPDPDLDLGQTFMPQNLNFT
jgi:hypothetical protein